MLIGVRWGSLAAKIFAWTFVPTALVVAVTAVISMRAYQVLALDLVIDRDIELTRLHADQIAASLQEVATGLTQVADAIGAGGSLAALGEQGTDVAASALGDLVAAEEADRLAPFDGGVLVLDRLRGVVAAHPAYLAEAGRRWAADPWSPGATALEAVTVSNVLRTVGDGREAVAVSTPIRDASGTVAGNVVGLLRVGARGEATVGAGALLPAGLAATAILVDANGAAVHHPDPAQWGEVQRDRPAVTNVLAGHSGSHVDRIGSGPERLATYAPVRGTDWGLVEEQSWSAIAQPARRFGQLLLALLLVGLTIPALMVLFGARRLTQPINDLIVASQEVAQGRFGHTVEARTGDELEELARHFNAMSGQLEASVRDLERRVSERTSELAARSAADRRRAEQFRVIAEVGRRITTIMPVDELLDEIAQLVQQAFGYEHVGIGLVEDDAVIYQAGAGPIWEGAKPPFRPARLAVGREGISGFVAASGEPLLVDDVATEPRYVELEGSLARSELAVPIIAQGRVIGVLDAQSRRLAAFDDSDVTVMQSLANQAAIAIENARLYARARTAAILEERQRVARDLHDSVTQSLYGVSLYGDAASRMLEAADVEGATELLSQLRQTAKDALQEMRLLIFELRPSELERMGLVGALQSRLDAVESRSGLAAALDADETLRLPLATEDALYRLAQEALNNALRHAQASSVHVRLSRTESGVRLEIADDGIGFDVPEARQSGGVGLHSMAERAAQVGARLEIDSRIGAGSRIIVEVPS